MNNTRVNSTVLLGKELLEPNDDSAYTNKYEPSQIHDSNSQCSYLNRQHEYHVSSNTDPSMERQSTSEVQDVMTGTLCERSQDVPTGTLCEGSQDDTTGTLCERSQDVSTGTLCGRSQDDTTGTLCERSQDDTVEVMCEKAHDDTLCERSQEDHSVEVGEPMCSHDGEPADLEVQEGCIKVQQQVGCGDERVKVQEQVGCGDERVKDQQQVALPEYAPDYCLETKDATCELQEQGISSGAVCDPEHTASGVQSQDRISSVPEEQVLNKQFAFDTSRLSSDVVLTYLNTSQGPQFLLLPVTNIQNSAMISSAIIDDGTPSTSTNSPLATHGEGSLLNVRAAGSMAGQHITNENNAFSLTKQNKDQIHDCKWIGCQETFGRLQHLVNHVSDIHIKLDCFDEMYVCRWIDCPRKGRGFNARYKVLIHVRTHTQEKPHVCFVCRKRFSRLENLKIHNRTHTGERPYTCPYSGCGKAYSNSSDRFKHVLTHRTERPYCCKAPQCNKRYTDPSSLRKHMRAHGHLKPEKQDVIEEPIQATDLSAPTMAAGMLAPCYISPDLHFLPPSAMNVCSLPSACSETSDRLLANPLLSSATSTEAPPAVTLCSLPIACSETSDRLLANPLLSSATSTEAPPAVTLCSLPIACSETSDRLLANPLLSSVTSTQAPPAVTSVSDHIDECKTVHAAEVSDAPEGGPVTAATSAAATSPALPMESPTHPLLDPEIGVDHQALGADSLQHELCGAEEQCNLRDDLMGLSSICPTNCTCGHPKKLKNHHKSSHGLRNRKRNCLIAPRYTQEKKMAKPL